MLAGGGMGRGQIIGSTDRTAAVPDSRPVSYLDVMATLYAHLGIDSLGTTISDPTGRPQYLIVAGELIREVV
jgi:hypothetical protein